MSSTMKSYFRRLAEGHEKKSSGNLLYPFLDVACGCYSSVVQFTRSLYERNVLKRTVLPFPVISVGNLTWGGSGKTPFVEYLGRRLGEMRRQVLILTRGYSHDEVEQFRHNLSTALLGVGADRRKIALDMAKKHRIDIAILDDGLQHFPVARNLEVVTVNALNPFGNEKLLPRGILREPLNILSRADVVVISHINLIAAADLAKLKQKILSWAPKAAIVESYLEPLFFYRAKKRVRVPLERLQKQRVTTFSAVGSPRSFQLLLSKFHIKPARNFEFTDHHMFSRNELQEIKNVSQSSAADEVITTEKDYYRSPELISEVLNPLILATRLRISSGEEQLLARIKALIEVRN